MSAQMKEAAHELQESEMYLIGFLACMYMKDDYIQKTLAERFDMHISLSLIAQAVGMYKDLFPHNIRKMLFRYAIFLSSDFYDFATKIVEPKIIINSHLRPFHCTLARPAAEHLMKRLCIYDPTQAKGMALGELQSALGARGFRKFYPTAVPYQMWMWWDRNPNAEKATVSDFRFWLSNDARRSVTKLDDFAFMLRENLPDQHPQKNSPWIPMLEYVFQFIRFLRDSNPLDLLSVTKDPEWPTYDLPEVTLPKRRKKETFHTGDPLMALLNA